MSATEALAQVASVPYDAIISDCQMPGMDASGFWLRGGNASGRTGIISDEVQGPP